MFEFLDNDICKFKVIQNSHLLIDGVNAFVSVFFKRDQYYKNFGIYLKGLRKFLQALEDPDFNPDVKNRFIFVLFIDQNVLDDSQIMSMLDSCQLCVPVLFSCSKYMKDNYHVDLFGTLIRFFPMFDFPSNPVNIVVCTDIDLHDEDYVRLASVIKHRNEGITGAGDIARVIYQKKTPYMYAGLICYNRPKYDHRLLIDFIESAHTIKSKGHYGKRFTPFGHGVDEIFLNDFFFPAVGTVNIIIDYQISYFLYHSSNYILASDRIDVTNKILSIILGPYDEPTLSPKEKMEKIDKYTYQIRERTDINDELSRRFTKVIEHLTTSKKKWMESSVLNFINSYLKHVISSNIVINYDYKKQEIIGVETYETINDTEGESTDVDPDNLSETITSSVDDALTSDEEKDVPSDNIDASTESVVEDPFVTAS